MVYIISTANEDGSFVNRTETNFNLSVTLAKQNARMPEVKNVEVLDSNGNYRYRVERGS